MDTEEIEKINRMIDEKIKNYEPPREQAMTDKEIIAMFRPFTI